MTSENWKRLQPEVLATLELPEHERARYLQQLSRRDPHLSLQLASLLSQQTEVMALRGDVGRAEQIPIFSPGEVILDRFEIVRLLGSGGMGDVYEANDWQTERIALKSIRPALAARADVLAHFKQEVRLARKVSGPNVCRIHELFVIPQANKDIPRVFFTMEFLEGETLADRIAKGPLPWDEALRIALEICDGLSAIHEAGIIHRDLKSHNVMLSVRSGKPAAVLTDFGLAQENLKDAVQLSGDGTDRSTGPRKVERLTGTPMYMAPEQWDGRPVTAATDIYALGLILYEMVSGEHPFAGASLLETALLRSRPRRKISTFQAGIPRGLDEVIERCLSYEPGQRYQSAAEVAAALGKRSVRGTLVAAAAGLAAIAVVAGGLLWYRSHVAFQPNKEALSWYRLGVAAEAQGAYYRAANAFESAVQKDGRFALARAHLADTWSDLDYQGKADAEIGAIDVRAESTLREPDQDYIEAVRAYLHDDHQRARALFTGLLSKVPEEQRALAYVDLAREDQRAGDIDSARKNLREAIRLAPQAPVTHLQLGVLESKQRDHASAEEELSHAGALYQTLGDTEGLATIAYLRGQVALNVGHAKAARDFFNQSLSLARNINNVALQVRAEADSSATLDGQAAVDQAAKAVRLAHDSGLEYWETEALIREGNAYAYLDHPNTVAAEENLGRAMHAAELNHWPALLGMAQLSLAAVRDGENKPDAALAQAALQHFKSSGSRGYEMQALTLLARAQVAAADFKGALKTASDLELSKSINKIEIAQAEETVGDVYAASELFPQALQRYRQALQLATASGEQDLIAGERLNVADSLEVLGEYDEAARLLKEAGVRPETSLIKAGAMLSQQDYRGAIAMLLPLSAAANRDPKSLAETHTLLARAYAGDKQFSKASRECEAALKGAPDGGAPVLKNDVLRIEAEAALGAGNNREAIEKAADALQFFRSKEMRISEWQTLVTLAVASGRAGDRDGALRYKSSASQVLQDLANAWKSPYFVKYLARPDVKAEQQELASIQ